MYLTVKLLSLRSVLLGFLLCAAAWFPPAALAAPSTGLKSIAVSEAAELSKHSVVSTVTTNGIAWAVGRTDGVVFRTPLRGGLTEAFGVSQSRLAFTEAGKLYLADIENKRSKRHLLAEYRVAVVEWAPQGDRLAVIFEAPGGFAIGIHTIATGEFAVLHSGPVLTDLLRWSNYGEDIYFLTPLNTGSRVADTEEVALNRASVSTKALVSRTLGLNDAVLLPALTDSEIQAFDILAARRRLEVLPMAAPPGIVSGSRLRTRLATLPNRAMLDVVPLRRMGSDVLLRDLSAGNDRQFLWDAETRNEPVELTPEVPPTFVPLGTGNASVGRSAPPSSCRSLVRQGSLLEGLYRDAGWFTADCGQEPPGSLASTAEPRLLRPGTPEEDGESTELVPSLTWETVPSAVSYEVYVTRYKLDRDTGEEVYATSVFERQDVPAGSNSLVLPEGVLEKGGRYRWNVRVRMPTGNVGSFAPRSLRFFIPSEVPSPISPGSEHEPDRVDTANSPLTWMEVEDPAAYLVEIRAVKAPITDPGTLAYSTETEGISLRIPTGTLLAGRTYSWQVQSLSSDGVLSPASTARYFTPGDGTQFAMALARSPSQVWNHSMSAGHYWNGTNLWIRNKSTSGCWGVYIVDYSGGFQAYEAGFIEPYIQLQTDPSGWNLGIATGSADGPATCTTTNYNPYHNEMTQYEVDSAKIVTGTTTSLVSLTPIVLNLMDDDPGFDDGPFNHVTLSVGADVTGPGAASFSNQVLTGTSATFNLQGGSDAQSGLYGYEFRLAFEGSSSYSCYSGNSSFPSVNSCALWVASTQPFKVQGLSPGKGYTLRITPYDYVGNAGQLSEYSFTTKPEITITTSPAGLKVIIDGGSPQTAPVKYTTWSPGATHTIAVDSPQAGPNSSTRYKYSKWSDGQAMSHQIITPSTSTTYTATFLIQYKLTTAASPTEGGSVSSSPTSSDGFYDTGTSVLLTAKPTSPYYLGQWSGGATGTANPTPVTMDGPKSVTANFKLPTHQVTVKTNTTGLYVRVDNTNYLEMHTFTWDETSTHNICADSPQGEDGNQRYVFTDWSDGYGSCHDITVGSTDANYRANFKAQYRLQTAANPAAGGTVSASPTSTDGYYNSGAGVTLTAAPASGYTFQSWSGGANGTANPTTVTMNAPKSVTASFSNAVCSITLQSSPTGLTVQLDSSSYVTPKTLDVTCSSQHTIAAPSPQSGGTGIRYVWSSWSDQKAISHTITAPANGNAPYTANFTTQHLLVATASPVAGGTVSANPTSPDGYYNFGAGVTLTAAPANGYTFQSWSGDATGTANPTSVTMNGPKSVTASFSNTPCSITLQSSPTGLTVQFDSISYVTPQTLSATCSSQHTIAAPSPQSGGTGIRYVWSSWSDQKSISHTITAPANGNAAYAASFSTQYLLTATASPTAGGTVSASPTSTDGYYNSGAGVTLTAAPASGYTFQSWSGGAIGNANPTSVTMNAPKSVTATFITGTCSVTLQSNPTGLTVQFGGNSYTTPQILSVTCGSQYPIATTSPQSGSAGTRYVWSNWSDQGTMLHNITTPAIGGNAAYTAYFNTQYLLTATASPTAGGTVSASPTSADGYYNNNTQVSLTAKPASNYKFQSWSGGATGTANPTSVTMNAPKSVTANYTGGSGPDFNGDGKTDIVWRNYQTGYNQVWFMNGAGYLGPGSVIPVSDLNWKLVASADFNSDGKPDLLWRHAVTGENIVWFMNGTSYAGQASLSTVADLNYHIVGVTDFNGDGKPDLLWRNYGTGQNIIWYMNGTSVTGVDYPPAVADVNWKIVGAADFNADGKPDIVWRHATSGADAVWYMNGASYSGQAALLSVTDMNWKIAGVADYNNDGKPDLLWRNFSTGENILWFLNGVNYSAAGYPPNQGDTKWVPAGDFDTVPPPLPTDFNDDNKPDLLWRNTTSGQNLIWLLNGTAYGTQALLSTVADANFKLAAVADFNGDGKPDLLWRHYGTGQNIVWYMNGSGITGVGYPPLVSDVNWKIVGAADFNADGKPDIVWRHATSGQTMVWYMNGTAYTGQSLISTVADLNYKIAAIADFNGDGKPDLLWRHYGTGQNTVWYMNGASIAGVGYPPAVADTGWKIVGAADFNADGKPDIVWRHTTTGANAVWYMNGVSYLGYGALPAVTDPKWIIAMGGE